MTTSSSLQSLSKTISRQLSFQSHGSSFYNDDVIDESNEYGAKKGGIDNNGGEDDDEKKPREH